MRDVPDLAALVAEPGRVVDVPPEAVPALLGEVEALKVRLWQRVTMPAPSTTPARGELLDVQAAAARLGVTVPWLRRRPTLPFVVKLSDGVVRYSARGLERYIRQHTQHGA